jgi:uncharacterized membrane protein (UPF0127 family)
VKTVKALNLTRDTIVAETVEVAASPWSRFWGLMGRRDLPAGQGILITPCSSIHMFFMRFPIDVVFLNKEDRVVKIVNDIKPWRTAMGGGGRKALELPAGAAAAAGISDGDQLAFRGTA